MPKRSEVERILDHIGSQDMDLRALLRAAERMRGVISADDSASVPAIAFTARAYDRAKRRILGEDD